MDRLRLKRQLIIDEGVRNKVYKDSVGIPTIGVGRNLQDKGLSEKEISFLLDNDIDEVETELNKNLPWYKDLDPVRQEVLCNMCFNLGWPRLSLFKVTLHLIETKQYSAAATAMLQSKWATQVGNRAKRLAAAMRDGSF